jgi:transposase InsO family protein
MIVNQKKSIFGKYQIPPLGFIIDGEGIKVHPSKTKAILDWPPPKNGQEIKRFMATANYNRNSIKDFSIIGAPLDALRESKSVSWNESLEASFNGIKQAMVKAATLVSEDPNKTVLIGTDASKLGYGFWRGQVKDEYQHIPESELNMSQIEIIQYGSIATKSPHAGVTLREGAAIIWAIKKCLKHLWGRRFILYTDHSALVYLFTKSDPESVDLRWIDLLMSLNFEVVHWRGEENFVADTLSRPSCIQDNAVLGSMELISESALIRNKTTPATQDECDKLIQHAHLAGHFGKQQVFLKIWHDGFWWPGIRQDIDRIIGICDPCLRYNVIQSGFHPLGLVIALKPGDHAAVDLIELPPAYNGRKFALVYLDIATRFVMIKTLRDKSGPTVARAFYDIACLLGFPSILQSDNGTEFVNQVLKALVKLEGLDHRLVSEYHPQANGAVERANRIVKDILRKVLKGAQDKWIDHISYVQFSYNTHINKRTGSTPFALMFGRDPPSFKTIHSESSGQPFDLTEWKKHLLRLNKVVYGAIESRAVDQHRKNMQAFARQNKVVPDIPPGAKVYLLNVTKGKSINDTFEGPFEVIRKNQGGAYLLKDGQGKTLPIRATRSHLKHAPDDVVLAANSYEVLRVIDQRGQGPHKEYKVQWVNPEFHDSWLTPDHFDGTRAIAEYFKRNGKKRHALDKSIVQPRKKSARIPKIKLKLSPPNVPYQHLEGGDVGLSENSSGLDLGGLSEDYPETSEEKSPPQ